MQGLPFHYIELATDLCKYAREDLQDWNLSYDVMVFHSLSTCRILSNKACNPSIPSNFRIAFVQSGTGKYKMV